MCAAFPRSDYYGASAPSAAVSRRRACPWPRWLRGGRAATDGSHVHHMTVHGGGVRLCPGSIADGTPQAFPTGLTTDGFKSASELAVTAGRGGHALRPGPYPPDSSRHIAYGALHHRFLAYTFPYRLPDPACLAVPDRPGVVRTASRPPRRLPGQTVLSFPGQLRLAESRALSSLPVTWRLVAHEPVDVLEQLALCITPGQKVTTAKPLRFDHAPHVLRERVVE